MQYEEWGVWVRDWALPREFCKGSSWRFGRDCGLFGCSNLRAIDSEERYGKRVMGFMGKQKWGT
jgi:hypothetical protein